MTLLGEEAGSIFFIGDAAMSVTDAVTVMAMLSWR